MSLVITFARATELPQAVVVERRLRLTGLLGFSRGYGQARSGMSSLEPLWARGACELACEDSQASGAKFVTADVGVYAVGQGGSLGGPLCIEAAGPGSSLPLTPTFLRMRFGNRELVQSHPWYKKLRMVALSAVRSPARFAR